MLNTNCFKHLHTKQNRLNYQMQKLKFAGNDRYTNPRKNGLLIQKCRNTILSLLIKNNRTQALLDADTPNTRLYWKIMNADRPNQLVDMIVTSKNQEIMF